MKSTNCSQYLRGSCYLDLDVLNVSGWGTDGKTVVMFGMIGVNNEYCRLFSTAMVNCVLYLAASLV